MDPNSMILPAKNVPKRDMPRSSVSGIVEETEAAAHHVHFGGPDRAGPDQAAANGTASAKPMFTPVDFTSGIPEEALEDAQSPTEQRTSNLS